MEINIEHQFTKTLMYLDRNKTDIAKKMLEETFETAKKSNNNLYCIKINIVLGELYFEEENNIMTKKYLSGASVIKYEDDYDDVLDYEKERCIELLNKINNLIK